MTPASPTTGSFVNARRLTRWFGADNAVHGVDLTVAPGEIHALVGLNGAGKTTLMRMVLGMLRPDAGAVRLFGDPSATPGRRCGHASGTCSKPLSATANSPRPRM